MNETNQSPTPAVARTQAERKLRGLSVRSAAMRGDISNTLWGRFEKGGIVTDAVRTGVAAAFGWPLDWPENPPPLPEAREDQLLKLIAELALEVRELAAEVRELRCELRESR